MMYKWKFFLILAYCLSIDAACEETFISRSQSFYRYGPLPDFNPRFYYIHRADIYSVNITTQIITCSNVSVKTSLKDVYDNATNHHLAIVNSTVPVVTTNYPFLSASYDFKKLVLRNLEIENIEIGAFEHLRVLEELDLSHNKLVVFPEEILRTLTYLRKLDISRNAITGLKNVNFSKVVQLSPFTLMRNKLELNELNFSHNRLVTIPEEINAFTNLRTLDVSNNIISNFHFSKLVNLTDLMLAGNNLKELHGNMFESLERLRNLDISNNPLTKFKEMNFKFLNNLVASNTSLETLNFHNVRQIWILEIHNSNLTETQHLCEMDSVEANLSHNSISKLDEIPQRIAVLDLSYNKILRIRYFKSSKPKKVPRKTYYDLRHLNFAYNEISEIEPYALSNLRNLQDLNVGNNNLEALYENTIVNCPMLWEVDFSFNKINHIESNAFKGVPQLYVLNLSHNKLKLLNLEMLPRRHRVEDLFINHNELTDLEVQMFQDVFPKLKSIAINHNLWLCKDLKNVLVYLQTKRIKTKDGVQSANLNSTEGFSCKASLES